MKILPFLPLLIWMLGALPMFSILHRLGPPPEDPRKAAAGAAMLYVLGCCLWLGLGLICTFSR